MSITASVAVSGCSPADWPETKLQRSISFNEGWKSLKQDINLADFEGSGFGSWTTTGTALGSGPACGAVGDRQTVTGFLGKGFANSYTGGKDATGTLTPPAFTIERGYINFLVSAGSAVYAADAPAMQWHKGLGTDTEEKCQHVMQTSDGGYLVVGMTDEAAGRASDMLIIKADVDGNEQWQKIIGTTNQHDWANISAEVADGYIVAGALSDSGDQERGIVKLDFDGNIVSGWPKTYHADGVDAIRGIDITSDGSIVATGYVGGSEYGYLFICDSGNGSIMKTDLNGNLQWDKILPSTMHGMRVKEVAGGFAIGGNQWIYSGGKNHQNVVLVLTDSKGNEKFSETYGGDGDDQVFDFAVTTDGGYIFGGHSRSPSYGTVNWDFFLLKVGSDKKEQWHRTFGQPRGYDAKYIHDEAYGVQQTPDGGFIIAGGSGDEYPYSASGHPAGSSDEWKAYLVKTDASGNVQWEGVYPRRSAGGNNAAEHINLTSDGGYIVCSDTDTAPGPVPNNFGLMKIAPDKVTSDN